MRYFYPSWRRLLTSCLVPFTYFFKPCYVIRQAKFYAEQILLVTILPLCKKTHALNAHHLLNYSVFHRFAKNISLKKRGDPKAAPAVG